MRFSSLLAVGSHSQFRLPQEIRFCASPSKVLNVCGARSCQAGGLDQLREPIHECKAKVNGGKQI